MFDKLGAPDLSQCTPPSWLVDQAKNRLLLGLNHVLQQNPVAMGHLARHAGKRVRFGWQVDLGLLGTHTVRVLLTASRFGLLEQLGEAAGATEAVDLSLDLTEPTPLAVAQKLAQGRRAGIRIEGDVNLAADIQWLMQNVRWDVEADLARVLGDVTAHRITVMGRSLRERVESWIPRR